MLVERRNLCDSLTPSFINVLSHFSGCLRVCGQQAFWQPELSTGISRFIWLLVVVYQNARWSTAFVDKISFTFGPGKGKKPQNAMLLVGTFSRQVNSPLFLFLQFSVFGSRTAGRPVRCVAVDDGSRCALSKAEFMEKVRQSNEACQRGDFREAVRLYGDALQADPQNCILYSNRSAALLKLGQHQAALEDAEKACGLNPKWLKVRIPTLLSHKQGISQGVTMHLHHGPELNQVIGSWFRTSLVQ
uniref:TTC28 n=1 Tax=Poeciliopsis prolifica TaxID=188132 RepID=A0A0S7ENX4_9TELE